MLIGISALLLRFFQLLRQNIVLRLVLLRQCAVLFQLYRERCIFFLQLILFRTQCGAHLPQFSTGLLLQLGKLRL